MAEAAVTPQRFLPRAAVVLGIISLCNDLAGEMLAPVIPLFLTTTLGAGPAIVGLVEGFAQSCASVLKLLAGLLVDNGVRPKRLMLAGYGLASSVRPLIGIASSWGLVLALRALDRIGKGLRGAPRDALLAASVDDARLGRAFGFHRAMDYVGSGLGPAIGAGALTLGMSLKGLFALAVIPGLAVMVLILFGVSSERLGSRSADKPRALPAWASLPGRLRGLLLAATLLAVSAVHDAFLVLWLAKQLDHIASVLLVFALINGVRAVVAMFGGELSDRLGTLPTILVGWTLRIGLLLWIASASSAQATTPAAILWVVSLAAAMAWSAPAELALLTRAAPDGQRGTLLGTYHMLTGLAMLPGTALFGLLWQQFGVSVAFLSAALGSALAALTLLILSREKRPNP
ncbi:MAG: MFS transporter [Pseudomonadota bacterium]